MINLLKKIQCLFITPKNSVDIDSKSISTSESIESNIELIGRERLTQAIQLEEEDDEGEGDITQEGEDAEEQQVRILQLLVFAERFNSRDETQFAIVFAKQMNSQKPYSPSLQNSSRTNPAVLHVWT